MDETDYVNPLISRYGSAEMSRLFGAQHKFTTWRKLWLALAETQQELGLEISAAQLDEMRQHSTDIDFERAAELEKKLRHDVMAHVHLFGERCQQARPIIHLGATSCFVTDNADLIIFRDALQRVRNKLLQVIDRLARFAEQYRSLATLGLTHLQPAQPTTVGKRATLWAYDFVLDLQQLEFRLANLAFRGAVGTTGTQASFLKLYRGDHQKVKRQNEIIAAKLGFDQLIPTSGQTYTRKIDCQILDVLAGIAQSAHKMATDIRLLAHRKEIEEPFEKHQIGSSAMAYKRNPMRSERICSLARFVMTQQAGAGNTHATQWLERTLDDSAIRRLILPQSFLGTDAILILLNNVTDGLVVYEKVIENNLMAELPFMATENILMAAVAVGGDRQVLHESIRQHSQAAARQVKELGAENDLIDRLTSDPAFASVDIEALLDPQSFIGRAPQQVDEFIEQVIEPIRAQDAQALQTPAAHELRV